jgi:MEMO1 family protein
MSTRKRSLPRGWYPTSEDECQRQIREFLSGFSPPEGHWTGGVAPHAGWAFSGKAAARVVRTLAGSSQPDRVVIYGGHLSGSSDPIIYTDEFWETPVGLQRLDSLVSEDVVKRSYAIPAPSHYSDNTVEIQLPLVKHFFPSASVIALHSPASERAIRLGLELETLLAEKGLAAVHIASADLTHYGPNYGFTPRGTGPSAVRWVREENDKSLLDKALSMDAKGLLRESHSRQNTCSPGPIASVIAAESSRGVKQGHLLEYYTSYDIIPSSSFVGYAGIIY